MFPTNPRANFLSIWFVLGCRRPATAFSRQSSWTWVPIRKKLRVAARGVFVKLQMKHLFRWDGESFVEEAIGQLCENNSWFLKLTLLSAALNFAAHSTFLKVEAENFLEWPIIPAYFYFNGTAPAFKLGHYISGICSGYFPKTIAWHKRTSAM